MDAIIKNRASKQNRTRGTSQVLFAGFNRGAKAIIPALAEIERSESQTALTVVAADPRQDHLDSTSRLAREHGLSVTTIPARAEVVLGSENAASPDLVLGNVDSGEALAAVATKARDARIPMAGYMFARVDERKLWGLQFAVPPGKIERYADVIAVGEGFARVTARGGNGEIFGVNAMPDHRMAEPTMRKVFREHARTNVPKLLAGLPTNSYPLEAVAQDGSVRPVVVRTGAVWAAPSQLARDVLAHPDEPFRRGSNLLILEVCPEGVRFHEVRIRTDGRASLGGVDVIDRARVEAMEARAASRAAAREKTERARTELAVVPPSPTSGVDAAASALMTGAVTNAARTTVTASSPALVTD